MDSVSGSNLYWFSDSNFSSHHTGKVFDRGSSHLFSHQADVAARYHLMLSDLNNNGTQIQLNSSKTSNDSKISETLNPVGPCFLARDHYLGIIMILYIATSLTACVLNILTMFVLWCGGHHELTKYLINLSFSDIIMNLSGFGE